MADTSTMVQLASAAPDFRLPDVTSGAMVSRAEIAADRPLLVIFLCRHCPYVQHVKRELTRLGRDYAERVAIVGISSNNVAAYPEDSPARLADMAKEEGFTFPILYDESQEVARACGAACTPDFFLFDSQARLVYRGRLDETRPNSGRESDGADLRAALDSTLADVPVVIEQLPSIGCSIKWR